MIPASTDLWPARFDSPIATRRIQTLNHFVWRRCVIAGFCLVVAFRPRRDAACKRCGAAFSMLAWMIASVPATAVLAAGADPPAAVADAEAADEEKANDELVLDAKTTVAFDRDPVQLGPNSMDVWALSFSAKDEFLAASGGAGYDTSAGQVQVWDFAKGQEIASYATPHGDLSVALSPDGRRVAWTSWSGDIWLREVGGAELLHEKLEGPLRVAFSPDGKRLVGASERSQLRTWDGTSGKQLDKASGAFHGGAFPFFWVGFSPDGKYLVAGGGKKNEPGGVKAGVWEVAKGRQLYKLSDDTERVWWGSISPDSKTLATNGDRSIVFWDLATGARRSQTDNTRNRIYRMQFSPDGALLAATGGDGAEGVVSLWDTSTGKVVGTLTGHEQDVRALAFTHDGKTLATGGKDRTIRLWDVATRKQIRMFQGPKGPSDPMAEPAPILATAFSPDGTSVATADEDGQVSVYALSPPRLLRSWIAHSDAAAALAYSPDGRTLVTGSYDKSIKIWNLATGDLVRTLEGHKGWILSLVFSHDGQTLASGSYDRTIRLWNVADGAERKVLAGHTATVRGWPSPIATSSWPAAARTRPCGCGTRQAARSKPRWLVTEPWCEASRFLRMTGWWRQRAKIRPLSFGTSAPKICEARSPGTPISCRPWRSPRTRW